MYIILIVRSEVPKLFCLVDHLPCFSVLGRPPAYLILILCKFINFKCVFDSWYSATHFERFKFLTVVKCSVKNLKKHMLSFIHLLIKFKLKRTKLKFQSSNLKVQSVLRPQSKCLQLTQFYEIY